MLVFGTGLYELFISHLGSARSSSKSSIEHKSNLFGLFTLKVSRSYPCNCDIVSLLLPAAWWLSL